jgi:hypothetical protein
MPCTESVHTEYSGQQGMVTLRYAECDSCGSEITGDADGRANKNAVLSFRSTVDCAPATGDLGLVCAQATCDGFLTTERNHSPQNPDLECA